MSSKPEDPTLTSTVEAPAAPAAPTVADKPVEAPAAVSVPAAVEGKEAEKTEDKKENDVGEPIPEQGGNNAGTALEGGGAATAAPTATKEDSTPATVESAHQKEQAPATSTDDKVGEATAAMAATSISATEGTTTPGDVTVTDSSPAAPTWPETGPDHPLTKLYDALPDITAEAGHSEVYGIELSYSNAFHTKLILQKFLRANANDLTKAKQQLLDTLKWRKEFDPAGAVTAEYEKERFDGLGYILEVEGVPASDSARADGKDVVTFNVYGAVKDKKKTFGDLEGFLRWRVGLMERSVQKLNLAAATKPIPDYGAGNDPYQGYQVHDYLQVSFIRQDPLARAAIKKTIQTLSAYYPETLSRKFFVNVPVVMGWFYSAVKMLVPKETTRKFTVVSYGEQLAGELGKGIPKVYGGEKEGGLESVGEGMKLV